MTGDQDDKGSNVTGDDKDMGPTKQGTKQGGMAGGKEEQ